MKNIYKLLSVLFCIIIASAVMTACEEKYTIPENFQDGDQLDMPSEGEMIAVFDTSMGTVKVRLFPGQAPKAVENFRKLAEKKMYDNTLFHRMLIGEIVQGGATTAEGGQSIWGTGFEGDKNTGLYHYRGALSFARNTETKLIGSQFFFVVNDDKFYDVTVNSLVSLGYSEAAARGYQTAGGGIYTYDEKYYIDDETFTVFGQVYEGLEILDQMNAVETDGDQVPVEDIVIKSVRIERYKA